MNVHPSLSSPSFSSYCDDDDDKDDDKDNDNDEPISIYILQFVCFSFATRHLNIMGMKRKKMD